VQKIRDLDMLFFDSLNLEEKYNALILYKEFNARMESNRSDDGSSNMTAENSNEIPRLPMRNVIERKEVLENYPSTFTEAGNGRPVDPRDRRHFEHSIHLARQVLWGNCCAVTFYTLYRICFIFSLELFSIILVF